MEESKNKTYGILLAGGAGTRLWPISRKRSPKQFSTFDGDFSLVQNTIKRLNLVIATEDIRVVCGQEHFEEISQHMREIEIDPQGKIIVEPCGRNTAPAILLAALVLGHIEPQSVLCVFPADHVIGKIDRFQAALESAVAMARRGFIVTIGIKPGYPETGYGYIEAGEEAGPHALQVRRFVEKPDLKTAEAYVASGRFFWNSGMFAFRADVLLQEFQQHQPDILEKMNRVVEEGRFTSAEAYQHLPNISIDHAVMEKTTNAVVVPAEFDWSDIGSWKSLYDFLPKNGQGNVFVGDVVAKNTQNSLLMGQTRLIAANGLQNMAVVETPDAVFISDLENSRDVKSIVEELQKKNRKELIRHDTVLHAWGREILLVKKDNFCIKQLCINTEHTCRIKADPFQVLHIFVVKGSAMISEETALKIGDTFIIPANDEQVLKNTGREDVELVVFEI